MATICHTNEKIEAAHHKFDRRLLGLHGGTRSEMKTFKKENRLKEIGRHN